MCCKNYCPLILGIDDCQNPEFIKLREICLQKRGCLAMCAAFQFFASVESIKLFGRLIKPKQEAPFMF
jgi:hypothetical protein